jgi:drug/metabolite transporter (DMT)-like permease
MAPDDARPAWHYDVLLLLTVLIWGVNFPILKAALSAMHPHALNVFRFSVSALVLGVMYARRGDATSFFEPMRRHGWTLAGLGLLGYVFYQLCFILGVNLTTAGSAALIMSAAPLWTALVGRVLGTERLVGLAWIGLVAILAGTAVVVLGGAKATGGSLAGNALILLGSVLWGFYTALNTRVVHDVSPIGVTFFGIACALPFLVAIGAPYLPAVDWAGVTPAVWLAIVFSGGLSTGIAFVIWTTAVKHVGASNTAVYNNLVPFVAVLGGWLFLGEAVAWPQFVGGALIIGGLVVMRRARRPPRMPDAPAPVREGAEG